MAEVAGQLVGAVTFSPQEIAAFPKTRWYVGAGEPADSLGSNGDLYLDNITGDISQKESGTWV